MTEDKTLYLVWRKFSADWRIMFASFSSVKASDYRMSLATDMIDRDHGYDNATKITTLDLDTEYQFGVHISK